MRGKKVLEENGVRDGSRGQRRENGLRMERERVHGWYLKRFKYGKSNATGMEVKK